MALIDLNTRITSNWDEYNDFVKSDRSFIYVDGDVVLDNVGPASMNLTVGERWFDFVTKKYYKIPAKGLKIKPGKSVIIETSQEIATPFNIFGVVYGTGKNIFKGGFISTGKINPGFKGKLKIGYYNGSNTAIIFEPKDLLACCSFYGVETTLVRPLKEYISDPEPEFVPDTFWQRLKTWFKENWYSVVSIVVSLAALIVSIILRSA